MNWTNDDILLVEKFIDIKNKGYYADGAQLTEVYNRVLDKRVSPTNCGSCIRGRINELEEALNRFKRMSEKASESVSEVKVEDTPQEENKPKRKAENKK
jgi:ribosomal protein S21